MVISTFCCKVLLRIGHLVFIFLRVWFWTWVEQGNCLDLTLDQVIREQNDETLLVPIYSKRVVTGLMDVRPTYKIKPVQTGSNLLIITEFIDPYYSKLKSEINGAHQYRLNTATLILIRKLFENLILDLLRARYGMKRIELFYWKDRGIHHSLSTLISNLRENIDDFKVYTLAFHKDKDFFKFLDEIKEKGDAGAHSLDILPDPKKIDSWKTSINNYSELMVTTIQKINKTPKNS